MHIPELIYFDQEAVQREIGRLGYSLPPLQDIVNCYDLLGLSALTNSDFYQLLGDTHDLLYDKITEGQSISFGTVGIIKSEAYKIIQKPAGVDILLQKIEKYRKSQGFFNPDQRIEEASLFELYNNNVRILPSVVTSLENSCKFFTKSQRQYDYLQSMKKIVEGINEIAMIESWNGQIYYPGEYLGKFIIKAGLNAFRVNPGEINFLGKYNSES
ncbi:MAG: hypothetical protein V4714_14050 [Bacteroidota bacterium]